MVSSEACGHCSKDCLEVLQRNATSDPVNASAAEMSGMIDPQIFEHLKSKIDEDTKARDDLNGIIQKLERDVCYTQGLLSRVHSTPRSHYPALLSQVEAAIKTEVEGFSQLSEVASKYPYYKYAERFFRTNPQY